MLTALFLLHGGTFPPFFLLFFVVWLVLQWCFSPCLEMMPLLDGVWVGSAKAEGNGVADLLGISGIGNVFLGMGSFLFCLSPTVMCSQWGLDSTELN